VQHAGFRRKLQGRGLQRTSTTEHAVKQGASVLDGTHMLVQHAQ
jgi:hypothetical protein